MFRLLSVGENARGVGVCMARAARDVASAPVMQASAQRGMMTISWSVFPSGL